MNQQQDEQDGKPEPDLRPGSRWLVLDIATTYAGVAWWMKDSSTAAVVFQAAHNCSTTSAPSEGPKDFFKG